MIITRIEKTKGKQYRIYGDEQYLFSLYSREIKKYNIAENMDLDESLISEIYDEIIYKRAKERSLYLLERQSYSENGIKRKLISGGTPSHIADKVISFLKEYNYVDDNIYVSIYVNNHIKRKSRKQIYNDLVLKGVDKDLIDNCFDDIMDIEDYEQECFTAQFKKYTKGKNMDDTYIRQKVFRYFYGKGFSVQMIENAIKESAV